MGANVFESFCLEVVPATSASGHSNLNMLSEAIGGCYFGNGCRGDHGQGGREPHDAYECARRTFVVHGSGVVEWGVVSRIRPELHGGAALWESLGRRVRGPLRGGLSCPFAVLMSVASVVRNACAGGADRHSSASSGGIAPRGGRRH